MMCKCLKGGQGNALLQIVSYFSLRVALPIPSWCGVFPYWSTHIWSVGFGCWHVGWLMACNVIVAAVVGDGFPDFRFTRVVCALP